MDRNIVALLVGGVLFLGLYASWHNIQSAWGLAQAGRSVLAPEETKSEAASPGSLTGLAAKFGNSLMTWDGTSPRPFAGKKLVGVKYFAFYYSASWCPPCRFFTPELVSFYKSFKPSHPQFELIFVDRDRSEDEMLAYMRESGMPWPAVWYNSIEQPGLDALRYYHNVLPSLVLVDSAGQVLSDSYQGGDYVGPDHVLSDIKAIVK